MKVATIIYLMLAASKKLNRAACVKIRSIITQAMLLHELYANILKKFTNSTINIEITKKGTVCMLITLKMIRAIETIIIETRRAIHFFII
jgi:hypothetical protein